jgi:hypothetical protein
MTKEDGRYIRSSAYCIVVKSAFHDRMNKDDFTHDDLAFLRRMAHAELVEPHYIDQLVEEIEGVLQRCRADDDLLIESAK